MVWQQVWGDAAWELGLRIASQWPFICLQHACSAGVMREAGSAHIIEGASSDHKITSAVPSRRKISTKEQLSQFRLREPYSVPTYRQRIAVTLVHNFPNLLLPPEILRLVDGFPVRSNGSEVRGNLDFPAAPIANATRSRSSPCAFKYVFYAHMHAPSHLLPVQPAPL